MPATTSEVSTLNVYLYMNGVDSLKVVKCQESIKSIIERYSERYHYNPGNSVMAVDFTVGRDISFVPKTSLGRRLLAIRNRYIDNGGTLLNADQIDREIKLRRGGTDRA